MKMYEVGAKCGHVGKNYYIEKAFAVKAETAKDAAEIARWIPRVKHHQSDAILYVTEIDVDRYQEIRRINEEDAYLNCSNIQEQRRNCSLELKREREVDEYRTETWLDYPPFYHGKKRIRHPKKYFNRFIYSEELAYEAA